EVVRRRYLPTDQQCRAAHRRLADYFAAGELSPRQLEEFPWQSMAAGDWDRLAKVLSGLDFLDAFWHANPFNVRMCWAFIEAHHPGRMLASYRPVLEEPERHLPSLGTVASLLHAFGYLAEALPLHQLVGAHAFATGDVDTGCTSLDRQAEIFRAVG